MEKLRLIQCGVGGFGEGWLKNHTSTSPDFELAALVDTSETALEKAGVVSGIPTDQRFRSLEAALESVQADAVLTVTPPPAHIAHARLAFARGLHLMTEKPLAENLPHAREMIRLAQASGRRLVVSQQYRFTPFIARLRELVRSQAVGEIGHGHIDFYIPADFTGTFREKMDFPLLLDMSIHHFDLIRAVTGRDIRHVSVHSFRPAWSWYQHHSGIKALLKLEGGSVISYSGDWSAAGRPTTWHGTWRLQGAQGSLHLENDKLTLDRCERWGKNPTSEAIELPDIPLAGGAATLHAFAESIRTGIPAETSGAANFNSMAAVAAGIASAQSGHAVEVENL